MDSIEHYPLKGRRDCRSAMARELSRFLLKLRFTVPKSTETFGFARVFSKWASFNDRALSGNGPLPAAAVLPDRSVHEPNSMNPTMDESTWSGGDPEMVDPRGCPLYPLGDGTGRGFALFNTSELAVPIVVVVRARSEPERESIVRVVETAFVEDGSIIPDIATLNPLFVPEEPEHPIRYGRLLTLSDYYDRKARFSLQATQLLDSESSVGENRWLVQFEFTGEARVCVVRRVVAMSPKLKFSTVDGTTETFRE